eukprot:TRINITY_DN174_c0_g1_i1.p1 TRINITY_DN174_c0_g1~~TRINITY_DN174_c0_g1_i1.p1  ORF type:complete len:312 (-),score=69.62 TRINITY_DN174_c0_g1_i1:60-995(-)
MNKCFLIAVVLAAIVAVGFANDTTVIDGELYVITPHGLRLPQCVLEVPHNATVAPVEGGRVSIKVGEGADMVESFFEVPEECHKDVMRVREKLLARRKFTQGADQQKSNLTSRGWLDNAGWYPPASQSHLEKFSSTYTVPPRNPAIHGSQTLFYFIGMQDNDSPLVNIVQPVLTWGNGDQAWYVKSWICCPNNITVSSPPIFGINAGNHLNGYVERVAANTWRVDSEFNGKHTTLNGQVGYMNYNWADVTLEVYGVGACGTFASGAMTFSGLTLTDQQRQVLRPNWSYTPPTSCNGYIRSTNGNTIIINHN